MPDEKLDWKDAPDFGMLNVGLKRRMEIIERGIKFLSGATITTGGRLTLSGPRSLVLVDTTGGAVTLTLPPAATVTGYTIEAKVTSGIEPLTFTPHGSETVDGQPDVETYTRLTLVSDGANWVEL